MDMAKEIKPKQVRRSVWLVLTVFILFCYSSRGVVGTEKYSVQSQNHGTIISPPVLLQNGTAGTSIIYMNNTSAKVSATASTPTYDYVLRIVNQVTDAWKMRLKAFTQNNIGRLTNCTISFHNSTDGNSQQIIIANGIYSQQTGTWYDLKSLATVYISMGLQASDSQVSDIFVYLEILTPNKTTYAQYVLTFEIT
jgi:hypothetical protein